LKNAVFRRKTSLFGGSTADCQDQQGLAVQPYLNDVVNHPQYLNVLGSFSFSCVALLMPVEGMIN